MFSTAGFLSSDDNAVVHEEEEVSQPTAKVHRYTKKIHNVTDRTYKLAVTVEELEASGGENVEIPDDFAAMALGMMKAKSKADATKNQHHLVLF